MNHQNLYVLEYLRPSAASSFVPKIESFYISVFKSVLSVYYEDDISGWTMCPQIARFVCSFWVAYLLQVLSHIGQIRQSCVYCICYAFSGVCLHLWLKHQLLPCVHFHVRSHMCCPGGFIATLIAFIIPFSAVRFHMFPQISFLIGCIVTLIAFI